MIEIPLENIKDVEKLMKKNKLLLVTSINDKSLVVLEYSKFVITITPFRAMDGSINLEVKAYTKGNYTSSQVWGKDK